jgi:hypothetical protein
MNHTLNIKLSNSNFPSWQTQILAFVKANDAYGFLDGTTPPLAQTIPNTSTTPGAPATMANLDFLLWCQRDQMLLSVLISMLTEPLVVHAVGSVTAHQLWTTLVSMFAFQARSRVMQIHYRLATAKKGSSSITEYFQSFKAMCDNLAAAGQQLNDGSEYDPFVTSITPRLDPLSLDDIYGHLLAHEMRIEHNLSPTEVSPPMANISTWAPMNRGRGYRGRGRTTYRGRGPSPGGRGRGHYFAQDPTAPSRPIYQLCGKIGHTAPRCYQCPDLALAAPSPPAYSNAQAYYSSPSLPPEENWYPDTAVTSALTPSRIHPMRTKSQNNVRLILQLTDGTVRYPLPRALLAKSALIEPTCFSTAVKVSEWRTALQVEFNALLKNQTWSLVPPSAAHNVVGCK